VKISQSILKQIIQEEIEKELLQEGRFRDFVETVGSTVLGAAGPLKVIHPFSLWKIYAILIAKGTREAKKEFLKNWLSPLLMSHTSKEVDKVAEFILRGFKPKGLTAE